MPEKYTNVLNPKPFMIWAFVVLFVWSGVSLYLSWQYVDGRTQNAIAESEGIRRLVSEGLERAARRLFEMSRSVVLLMGYGPRSIAALNDAELSTLAANKPLEARKAVIAGRHGDLLDLKSALSRLSSFSEHISDVFLINKHGIVLATSNSLKERLLANNDATGEDYSAYSFFRTAMQDKIDTFFVATAAGMGAGFFTAAPVHHKETGEIIGVVALRTAPSFMNPWINQGAVFWSDSHGVVFRSSHRQFEMMAMPDADVNSLTEQERLVTYGKAHFNTLPLNPWDEQCLSYWQWASRIGQFVCSLGIPDSLQNDLWRFNNQPRPYLFHSEQTSIGDFKLTLLVAVEYVGSQAKYVFGIFVASFLVSCLLITLVTGLIYYFRLAAVVHEREQCN